MKVFKSCWLFLTIIFSVIFILISNVDFYVSTTDGGPQLKSILNCKLNYTNSFDSAPPITPLHNLAISKIVLNPPLLPSISFNTNILTSVHEFVNISDEIPIVKITYIKPGAIVNGLNKFRASQLLLIVSLATLFSLILSSIFFLLIYPLIKNPVLHFKNVSSQRRYRPDIDALRAIAVFMVIIYHFNKGFLNGGFIGVDIFFVISGYLITQIIYFEMCWKTFSFKLFYARRIKRIIPTLYFMLLIISIGGLVMLPSGNDTSVLSASIKANLFFIYNFYLLNNGHGYFDNPSNQQFLLHTWSLAVEEQFYLVFPFLLILCVKNMSVRKQLISLAIIGFFSLGFSIYFTYSESSIAYYMLPSRAFELLLGAILAIFNAEYLNVKKNHFLSFIKKYAVYISIFGLILIIVSSIFTSEKVKFPGAYALVPSVGTALFILAGCLNKDNPVNKFIANRFLVSIGIISYALYIWHWPILAFYHYEYPGAILTLKASIYLISIIATISIINYIFIERALKKIKISYKSTVIYIFILPFLLLLSLATILNSSPTLIRSPQRVLEAQMPGDFCTDNEYGDCIFGDKSLKSLPNILLIGDSHAAAFGSFLEELAHKNKFNFAAHTYFGCPPVINFDKYLSGNCVNVGLKFSQYIEKYSTIVISGEFFTYMSTGDSNFISSFERTLNYLKAHNKKIIILGDVPQYKDGSIEYIKRRNILYDTLGINYNKNYADFSTQNSQSNNIVKQIAKKNGIYYFDFEMLVARTISTYPFYEKYLLYFDKDHLNPHGSILLAKHIENTAVESELISAMLKRYPRK